MLFRGPDSELAGAGQKSHQVPHAVVIAVSPGWDLGIPQGLDELRRARIRRRQTGHSVRGDQGGRMGIAHLVAIQRELVSIGVYALESKNAWIRSLSRRSLGSAAHQDQSTDQLAAVRQASGPKFAFVPTGVPSNFA